MRNLRDYCLDDDCDVCEDTFDDEEESSEDEEDEEEEVLEDTEPCRAKCSWVGTPAKGLMKKEAANKLALVMRFM